MTAKSRFAFLRRPLVYRLLAVFFLVTPMIAAGSLADYSGGLIEFFKPVTPALFDDLPEPPADPAVGPRAGRLVVMVVDGLALSALNEMPHLNKLAALGAFFIARVETPSYSRTGYSTIATGSGPEFSGVSSNSYKGHSRVDSIFRRARLAGRHTAFVGFDWWLDLFEEDIMTASIDVGKANRGIRVPSGYVRRVLRRENYIVVPDGDWRAFRSKMPDGDRFGDPQDTPVNEDLLRIREAVRLLGQESRKPDLLFTHLQTMDYHGHIHGSVRSDAYRRAARDIDGYLRELTSVLDPARDVFMLTSDHGFTTANIDAGHGGYEDAVMNVPLILYGAGIKPGTRGRALQRDAAPTMAVLLGLPFPKMNQGQPLVQALQLSAAEKRAVQSRLDRRQFPLSNIHLKYLGRPNLKRTDWRNEYRETVRSVQRTTRLWNLPGAVCFVLIFFLLPFRIGLFPPRWYVSWLLYEIVFAACFLLKFNVYSMTMYSSLPNFLQWVLLIHLGAGAVCLGTRIAAARFASLSAAVHEVGLALVPGTVLKIAVVFVMLGNAAVMPHGFWLFAGLLMSAQAIFAAACAVPIALFFGPR